MNQKERQERSKNEIYLAALDEFASLGYDSVNIEKICIKHGISKGMMYHYFSSKDELFLLCAEKTFADLKNYVEKETVKLSALDIMDAANGYFLIRERFFQKNPKQKEIFETSMLRPPKHLVSGLEELRNPLKKLNIAFMKRLIEKMPLREGIDKEKVLIYLENLEMMVRYYLSKSDNKDLHSTFESAKSLLDMALFGVLDQEEIKKTIENK